MPTKNNTLFLSAIALTILTSNTIFAQELSASGFTGSIRTPNALISPQGKLQYQYNNYNDLNSPLDKTYNHVFTVGVNSHIEFGGRLTDWYNDDREANANGTLPGKRDLSGNLKFRLPTLHNFLPEIAVGVQDFGGEAVNFRSTYGVLSKKIGRTTASLGYAKSDGNGALDGEFASLDVEISPSVTLKTDYLGETFAVGLGLDTQSFTKLPIYLQLAGEKQKNDDWESIVGLTLTLPLDKKFDSYKYTSSNFKLTKKDRNTNKFIQSLESQGILHAKLGADGNTDVVLVENHTYNHSYLDILAVILGSAYRHMGGSQDLQIILSKQNNPLLAIQINMPEYGKFINKQPSNVKKTTRAWLPQKSEVNKVAWSAGTRYANRSPIDIRLRPEIRSNLGSEWGVFDYSTALRADIKLPLGKVADLVVSGSVPIAHSNLYDDGVFSSSKYESQINHVVLQKLMKPSPTTAVLANAGYGKLNQDEFILGQVEGLRNTPSGKTQIFAKTAFYSSQDDAVDDELIALGGLRHHIDFLDMDTEVSYGQFYGETRGVKAKLSKFYGDAELSAELKYIDTDDLSGRLSISLPLTPRKDKMIGNMVFRGSQSWNYGIETTIKDPIVVGSNRVRPNYMLDPALSHTLDRDYFDNGRLSPNHFINNIDQLKQRSYGLVDNN